MDFDLLWYQSVFRFLIKTELNWKFNQYRNIQLSVGCQEVHECTTFKLWLLMNYAIKFIINQDELDNKMISRKLVFHFLIKLLNKIIFYILEFMNCDTCNGCLFQWKSVGISHYCKKKIKNCDTCKEKRYSQNMKLVIISRFSFVVIHYWIRMYPLSYLICPLITMVATP